jgi:NADH:ubiquinone oxidoreductase subunit F (NADH-binding)
MPALTTGAYPGIRPRLLVPQAGREGRSDYERRGGYQPGLHGQDLISAVHAAGLRGRGGAAFPLARKLAVVASQPGCAESRRPVVVVNGEEGEPASVKDRWLLRTRPHLVIDGALRAASAVGAATAYIYVSDSAAARSVLAALGELDGPPIQDGPPVQSGPPDQDGPPVQVDVWQVEPGYVAGEETAAVNAINGRPAKPSEKPPRPFEEGVRGLPTLVSNVETIASLPGIATGTTRTADTFLMTLGGACSRPGLYEVPFGITIGEAVQALGGGLARGAGQGSETRGYVMGGYFAGLLNTRGHELPLDYDALSAAGSGLGCGAVTVLGPGDCPVGVTAQLLAYFARENAGQCGSCFNGTAAMSGVAAALASGFAGDADLRRLHSWCGSLPGRGACGTLDGAVNIARSMLREFPDVVDAHLQMRCSRCAGTDFTALTVPFAASPDATAEESAAEEAVL